MPYSPSRLDRLEQLLADAPVDTMALTQLDGFLTGVALSPEPVAAEEWMARVWLDPDVAAPLLEAASPALVGLVAAILEHYEAVVLSLNGDPDEHDCLFEDDDDGEVLWDGWVEGFIEAAGLQPDAWEALSREEGEAPDAINLLLALDEIVRGESGLPAEEVRAMQDGAAELIPDLVQALNQRRLDAIPRPAPRRVDQIGRNDPCPCGSGKKYKKCCGAAA